MAADELEPDDGPRVAPNRPKGSGDRAPRVVAALALAVVVTIGLAIAGILFLWLL